MGCTRVPCWNQYKLSVENMHFSLSINLSKKHKPSGLQLSSYIADDLWIYMKWKHTDASAVWDGKINTETPWDFMRSCQPSICENLFKIIGGQRNLTYI